MSEKLRALLEKATPRPWTERPGASAGRSIEGAGQVVTCGAYHEYGCSHKDNAALIVYLVNNAEAMLAVVDAARAVMAEWDEYGPTGTVSMLATHQVLRAALATLDTSGRTE